jgi:hypothetical protein
MADTPLGNDADVKIDIHDPTEGFDYRTTDDASNFDYRLESDGYDDDDEGINQNLGTEMLYLPPDQRPGIPGELLAQLVDPEIDDDTEAAEALRANANVKVGKVGKVARSLNAQSVRKLVKRATLRGQSGNRRGKPPRIPPGITSSNVDSDSQIAMYRPEDGSGDYPSLDSESKSSLSSGDDTPYNGDDAHNTIIEDSNTQQRQHQQALTKEERSSINPATTENDVSKKKDKQSNAVDETKDIPVEVVAATMEAGRKRESPFIYLM